MKTLEQIKQEGYKLHHTASRRGYTPVAARGFAEPYKGRFGEGYIVAEGQHYHFGSCKGSTQYEDISYYLK